MSGMALQQHQSMEPGRAGPERRRAILAHGLARALHSARSAAASSSRSLRSSLPEIVHTSQIAAQGTTKTLQGLPDPTLRWLTAASAGLGAGLFLAGSPRVVTAAGIAPALAMAAVMVLRPTPRHEQAANAQEVSSIA